MSNSTNKQKYYVISSCYFVCLTNLLFERSKLWSLKCKTSTMYYITSSIDISMTNGTWVQSQPLMIKPETYSLKAKTVTTQLLNIVYCLVIKDVKIWNNRLLKLIHGSAWICGVPLMSKVSGNPVKWDRVSKDYR